MCWFVGLGQELGSGTEGGARTAAGARWRGKGCCKLARMPGLEWLLWARGAR